MRRAAHPLGSVVSSNPCGWRGERCHHHGGGVCWLFVLLWIDHELIACNKWYKNKPKEGLCGVTFWPTLACTTPLVNLFSYMISYVRICIYVYLAGWPISSRHARFSEACLVEATSDNDLSVERNIMSN
jgi:hypothetical protein